MIPYKYKEDETLEELKEYIDRTYDEHYSRNKFQATEFIIDGGHGKDFVSVTYSSMHNDTERRMARIEKTCLRWYIMVS